jgi:serine/threonine protein kinase
MNRYYKHSEKGTVYIPEQFIWYIFECLCIVGLLLERGDVERNPMSDWIPIVHRDMKMCNVFLGYPDEKQYVNYPVPKLGDFGLAVYLHGGELTDHETLGTPGNYPVEQDPGLMRRRGMNRPRTTKANVWGIANIVSGLMIRSEGFLDYADQESTSSVADSDESVRSDEPSRKRWVHTEPEFEKDVRDTYSRDLRNLLYNCMRLDPNDRISLEKALKSIRAHRHRSETGFLRDEPADSKSWEDHRLKPDKPKYFDMVCYFRCPNTHVDANLFMRTRRRTRSTASTTTVITTVMMKVTLAAKLAKSSRSLPLRRTRTPLRMGTILRTRTILRMTVPLRLRPGIDHVYLLSSCVKLNLSQISLTKINLSQLNLSNHDNDDPSGNDRTARAPRTGNQPTERYRSSHLLVIREGFAHKGFPICDQTAAE